MFQAQVDLFAVQVLLVTKLVARAADDDQIRVLLGQFVHLGVRLRGRIAVRRDVHEQDHLTGVVGQADVFRARERAERELVRGLAALLLLQVLLSTWRIGTGALAMQRRHVAVHRHGDRDGDVL